MFTRLFKPKWQVGTTAQRLAAIDTLNPEHIKDQDALFSILLSVDEINIKTAAIKKLNERSVLKGLLEQAPDSETQNLIRRQMIQLLSESDLAALTEAELLEVALQHRQAKLRLQAAKRINKEHFIEELFAQGQDKAVLRHARSVLKEIREVRKQESALAHEIDTLCLGMEQLIGCGDIDPFFLDKYRAIEQHWSRLKPSETQKRRFLKAQQNCESDLNALITAKETEEKRQRALQTFAHTITQLTQTLSDLEQLTTSTDIIEKRLNEAEQTWLEATQWATATSDQESKYTTLKDRLAAYQAALKQLNASEQALNLAIKEIELFDGATPAEVHRLSENMAPIQESLQWPADMAKPTLLQHWEQAWKKLKQIQHQFQSNADEAVRALARKRRQLDAHIKKGELKIANLIHARIHHELTTLWGEELERQQQRLHPLETELQKLRDWHGFSTEPKKQELCERMEALIDKHTLAEPERANAIKALQEEWREQTAVNIIEDDPLWVRFQTAGQHAYQPVAEYYRQQAEIKQHNLQKRRELCQQLEQYIHIINWEQANWKKVEQTLRVARNEWKQYQPVHYPEAKLVQQRFFELVDAINSKLKQYWQKNLEIKQALIEKAKQLETVEDMQKAIDKAMFLQKQWKETGHTFRSKEQGLWQKFRSACNAVFARRTAEKQQQQAVTDQQISEAEHSIAEMITLSRLEDTALGKSQEQADTLQQKFAALNLPEKVSTALERKFNQARRSYEIKFDGIAARKQQRELNALADCAALCNRAETALLQGDEFDLASLETQWENTLTQRDKTDLQPRLDAIRNGTTENKPIALCAEHLTTLENLAIEAEVLMDIDTPETYRADRRAYQLDKLTDGIGTSLTFEEKWQQLSELRRRWYLIGAVDATQRPVLEARLQSAIEATHRLKKAPQTDNKAA